MAVLVTGGAGYIGSHTVRLLVQQQRDVVVLDSLELGTKSRIGSVPFFEGNISDEKLIEKICKKHNINEVIHFAAYKAVGESMEQPLRYYNNNVAGTINLVRGLLANGVERLVFSSSAAVYGNPSAVPVTEDSLMQPESVYAETYPTPDGTCIRDYIHVEDLADAHIKALDYLATGGKSLACNVGTGKGTSVLEVLDIAEQVSGRKVPHVITQRRPGDPTAVFADPTLVRALLGWKATHDLRDIISSAWNWHSKAENN